MYMLNFIMTQKICLGLLVPILLLNLSFAGLDTCVSGQAREEMACCTAGHGSPMEAEAVLSSTTCACTITVAPQPNTSAVLVESGKLQGKKTDDSVRHAPAAMTEISSPTALSNYLRNDASSGTIRYTKIYDLVSSYLL